MRKILYIILLFFGLSLLLSVTLSIRRTKVFINNAQKTEARVLSVKTNANIFIPEIVFSTSQGERITTELQTALPFEQGEVVEILYNPQNPQDVHLRSFSFLYPNIILSFVVGIIFLGLGGFRFLYFFWYQRRLRMAKKKFFPLQGKVQLSPQKKFSIPYTSLIVHIHYPKDQTTLSYHSPWLWRPDRFVTPKQELTVYVDQKHPNRYSIDIPHLSDMV